MGVSGIHQKKESFGFQTPKIKNNKSGKTFPNDFANIINGLQNQKEILMEVKKSGA